jgi:hypothetical protein
MKRWSSRHVLALVFGLLLAVGTVVSAVQASDMAVDLATSGCVDTTGAICCDDCGGDDGDVYTGACLPICAGGACGVIPSRITLKTADQPQMLASTHPASLGRAFSPDPYPPRAIDLV